MKNLMSILTPAALLLANAMMLSAAVVEERLSEVPEPASVIMMGAGLAGVAFMGWKRKQKK